MDIAMRIVLMGAVATAMTDVWALCRRRLFGTPLPDWALVGRWIAHLSRGQVRHAAISRAAPVRDERLLGWITHYFVGVAFAALMPAIFGIRWMNAPTFWPALTVGVVSVAAPFFILQPAMGAGVAARRTPRPGVARLQSVATHAVFGVGLYLGALALAT